MCDLTQFVVVAECSEPTAKNLATLFMERVILTFGMCVIIVPDADSVFVASFWDMAKILDIILWPLARNNHKVCGPERFHRVFNKVKTIQGPAVGTHSNFIKNGKTAAYGCNSAPIDKTSVSRSMAAIGQEFKLPLDIKLNGLHKTLANNSWSTILEYLQNVAGDRPLATEVVKTLVEKRCHYHQMRANNGKDLSPLFKVGDVVKAHMQV